MNENTDTDLRALYAASQEHVHAPDDLAARTLELLGDENAVATAATAENAAARKPRLSAFGRKPMYAAAACLALAALGFGAMQVVQHANEGATGSNAVSTAGLDFTLKAYAAGTQAPLAAGDNGMIVFEHASDVAQYSAGWDDNGTYTGCLFKVEAEGVKTVQAHLSKGMLYRYDVQNATPASDPDLLREALTWKPLARGLGERLGSYDEVAVGIASDGLDKDDPNKAYQVQTSKRLGQTAQLDYDDGDAGAYFGLWTDEVVDAGSSGDPALDQFGAVANAFEGAELTVTVTFEDGRTSTQIIELHAGNFLANWSNAGEDGMETLDIDPTLLANDAKTPDEGLIIRTVYGEVASSSSEPFPYANEAINEFENVTDEPMNLPDSGEGDFSDEATSVEIAGGETTLACANIDDATLADPHSGRESDPSLEVSDFTAEAVSSLPQGTPVEQTEIIRMGSLKYWNRIIEQRCGFTLSDEWQASEGATILHATATLTNTSAEVKYLRVESFTTLGCIQQTGEFHQATGKAVAPLLYRATASDGAPLSSDDDGVIEIQPGETLNYEAYWELNNSLPNRDDLAIGFGANGLPNTAIRISL